MYICTGEVGSLDSSKGRQCVLHIGLMQHVTLNVPLRSSSDLPFGNSIWLVEINACAPYFFHESSAQSMD